MGGYTIELSRSAANHFKALDKTMQGRVVEKLKALCADPFNLNTSKKLINRGGQRSARVGNLRILFDVDTTLLKLKVSTILNRGQVYRHSRK